MCSIPKPCGSAALCSLLILLGGFDMTPAPAETASALRIDDGRIHTLRLDGHDIARPGQNEPLWSLELFDTLDQQDRFIHARGNDRFTVRSAERDGRVTWTVCDEDGQCVAEVETWQDRQDGEIDFRLRLNRLDARYRLWRVWYPRFELAPLHEKPQQDYLITPTVYGQRIDDIHHQPSWTLGRGKAYPAVVRLRYPAKHTALQMVYYGGPAGGALMWTPDPTRRIKEFALDRNAEDRLRANWLHHPAAWVELTEPVEVSYPVRLQWVPGDWYDAAQRYRHWAMQQPWTQMGRLDQRSDVPDWLPALPSWVRVIREPTTP
jgi:hypothetical protein